MKQDNSAIERLIREQFKRELGRVGRSDALDVAWAAADKVLRDDHLIPAEELFIEEHGADDSLDPVSSLIGRRIERALRAGLVAAGVKPENETPFEVLVLRSTNGGQFNRVVARLMEHIAAHKRGETGHVLLVAAKNLYKKVKQILPIDKIEGLPSIEFSEDGRPQANSTAAIEVISADISLPELEERASVGLDSLFGEGDEGDSMAIAWVAGALDSMDVVDDFEAGVQRKVAPSAEPLPVPATGGTPVDPMLGQLFHLKYRIVKRIGKGGFGSVYEAEDERGAGNRVAIKVLSGKAAESAAQQQSFKQEARRVTRLSHPNVVDWKVFDETDEGVPYFVMELVKGEEFEETLRRERRIEPARAAVLLLQVLDALRAAHHLSKTESILHLDMKPANLFHIAATDNRPEQLKVLDFGIGQYIGDEVVEDGDVTLAEDLEPSDLDGPSTLTFARPANARTTSGGVHRSKGCTPEYASPEQCAHVMYEEEIRPLDGRSDLYSLGVVAFEMLVGQLPFKSKSRLDVMRMHREDVAPRVGSMGVRIPRKLATFVDRCLEKEPDKRWKNTNEAYQFLFNIVHPPVWKAVARVTVPILLVGGAVGVWAWMTREVVVPTVGLARADGTDLETSSLYLGPQRRAVDLTLVAAQGVLPGETSRAWSARRVSDGSALEGWSVNWSAADRIHVEAPASIGGRVEERIELYLEDDSLRTRPFSLVWLGEGTWSVPQILVSDRSLEEMSGMSLDPYDSSMDVWISGAGRGDLAQVAIQVGESAPLELPLRTSSADRSMYRLELADSGLADGVNTVTWLVADRAGAAWTRTAELEVVRARPAIERLSLVDTSAEKSAQAEYPETNKLLNAFVISPRTAPAMRVELSRPADVSWKLYRDGSNTPEMRGEQSGKRSFVFDLAGLAELRDGQPYRGRIELVVNEDSYVVHKQGSGYGVLERSLTFRFEDTLPTLAARWRTPARTQSLQPETLGGVLFTNESDVELLVSREHPVPMHVEASWWPAGEPERAQTEFSKALDNAQVQQASIPIQLTSTGEWVLRVRSFRYDSASERIGERADVEELYRVVLDRDAPAVVISGLSSGQVLTRGSEVPEMLSVAFDASPSASREASVDMSWKLVREDASVPSASGQLSALDPRAGTAQLALSGALRDNKDLIDGTYRIELSGRDAAGNELAQSSVDFIVALSGPELSLEQPSGIGKWHADAATGTWTIRVLASDPNGVAQLDCVLVGKGTRIPVSFELEPGSTQEEQALIGNVTLPYTLSESRVVLDLQGVDAHGVRSQWSSAEIELPVISRPSPERIAVAFGEHTVEPMRLVHGNAEFQYLFGGRGDEIENPEFARAGLASFNASPRKSRSRSWQVPFAAGAIEDYYLDEREVSVEQYRCFLEAPDGYMELAHWPPGASPSASEREALIAALGDREGDTPVSGVTWAEAQAYANWTGKRLPSWLEWEFAVRAGAEYRPRASSAELPAVSVTEATAKPCGGTWSTHNGFADLCGNVAEWTATGAGETSAAVRYPHQWALEDPGRLHARSLTAERYWVVGGHFASARADFSVADQRNATDRLSTIGFRCALSLSDVQDRLGHRSPNGPIIEERIQ